MPCSTRLSLRTLYWLGILAVAGIAIWLRGAYPPIGIWSAHDDLLFMRMSESLAKGEWLGPFTQLTLVKGAFFPAFAAFCNLAGIPLKLAEFLMYLGASLLAADTASRLSGRPWLFWAVFLILALNPMYWTFDMARMMREPVYIGLSLALYCLIARTLLSPVPPGPGLGIATGLVAAAYWLTREEGIWLLPAITVVALPRILTMLRGGPTEWRDGVHRLFFPVIICVIAVTAVNATNLAVYGVYRNNDFRNGPFPEAYGALARIKPERWERYVVFPRDAREKAYSASPAAKELAPYLDGELGRNWVAISRTARPWGCPSTATPCSEEILSGWFLWALRDSVSAAGHYACATCADDYYRQLADEINNACDTERISCLPRRTGLTPVWRNHYLPETIAETYEMLRMLISFSGNIPGIPRSKLTVDQAAWFATRIGQPVSGFEPLPPGDDNLRLTTSRSIARAYALVTPWLFWIALALCLPTALSARIAKVSCKPTSTAAFVFAAGLLVAVLARTTLLAFLETTSIPSRNGLYLSPAVPFLLVFVVTMPGMVLRRR